MQTLGAIFGMLFLGMLILYPILAVICYVSGWFQIMRFFFGRKREINDDTTPQKLPTPSPKRDGRKKKCYVPIVSEFTDEHQLPDFYWKD